MTTTTDQNVFADAAYLDMDLLRFTTAGSVDDGKSTLIGRLLYDSKSIFEDQLEAIEQTSRNTGEEGINLALLTDGLRAEREQKITIDVAYRYFATPRRKFIIADTPGHVQYTRNMVTGASTADLAIILVDAKNGVTTQSRRHAFISSLLQIPHMIVAVNKMDLVGYSESRFQEIVAEFEEFSQKLDVDDLSFIPLSALAGDNVVHKGENMPWYHGATLLHLLETVKIGSRKNVIDFRLPVQYVIRPHQNFRGFAGTIASGGIKRGEEIVVLPSRLKSRIKEIWADRQPVEEAFAGQAVTLTIEDEIDISRGDMIVRSKNIPTVGREFEAQVCWMHEDPLVPGKPYLIMHTTRTAQVIPQQLRYKIDVNTFHRLEAEALGLNEIGRVKFAASQPLYFDPYKINNETGSFILIDPASKVTVGAGMIRSISAQENDQATRRPLRSPNVVWAPWNITRAEREQRNGHPAMVVWFTGFSGSGKSTVARALERRLYASGKRTMLLDGDQVRHGLNGDLGFSDADRAENIRRVAHLSRLFFEHGNIVLCAFISPFKAEREYARQLIAEGRFIEVHIDCPLEEAQRRDPKGLYEKAQRHEIYNFTGLDSPYEPPEAPELRIDTTTMTPEEAVEIIWRRLGLD